MTLNKILSTKDDSDIKLERNIIYIQSPHFNTYFTFGINMARRKLFLEDSETENMEDENVIPVKITPTGEMKGEVVSLCGPCSCSVSRLMQENAEMKKKLKKAEKRIGEHLGRIYSLGVDVYELMQIKRNLDDFNGGMMEITFDVGGLKDEVEEIKNRVKVLEENQANVNK